MGITQNGALKKDDNDNPVMGGTSSSDNATIINSAYNPVTRRLLTDSAGGGTGTVTDVSVVSANGFAGTVATSTTTPAITLSTTITGILKGDGTAISAASAATDYAALAFKTIAVSGQSDVVADSPVDTLTLVGSGITITTNAATDTITFTGGASGLTVGTTTIASGTTTRILYDNAGVLGEYTLTGSGTVAVMQTSPTLITPVLGVATATSINKMAITAPATSSTLAVADGKTVTHNATTTFAGTDGKTLTISNSGTLAGGDAFVLAIAAGKTLTVSNTLTFTGTDSSSVAFGTGGTVLYTTSAIPLTVGTTTIASGTTTRILYDNAGVLGEYTLTGTGTVVVMATSPTFTTGATTPQLLATANDSGALGASGTAFADLFLASGGVINWAANNSNITHSTGILTVGAGEFRITSANVGTNADSVPSLSSTSTLTNKRVTPRVLSAASYTTDTGSSINGDTQDMFIVTAQTGALKFNNPSGTPTDGQKLIITVASSTTSARALTWDTAYGSTTVTLPSTTAATTVTLSIGFIWSASKSLWQCVAVA